jgi:Cu(I)/Ag(I) efflux system membrane fusion protein
MNGQVGDPLEAFPVTPTPVHAPVPDMARASGQEPAVRRSPVAWQQSLWTVIKIAELRLRFVVLIVGTGLVFGYWDTFANRFEKWSRPSGPRPRSLARVEYYCPMHPSVTGDKPDQCPICGMALARRALVTPEAVPEGALSQVRLSPGQIAQAGVRTVTVEYFPWDEDVRAVGFIGFDESRRALVASNARGRLRVVRLAVASDGVTVQAGQPLAWLYGYDVSQAIQSLLEASSEPRLHPEVAGDAARVSPGDREQRLEFAVRGLKVLGIGQDQIDAISGAGLRDGLLPVLAPIAGHVIKKNVSEGEYVAEGTVLFEVADLGHVWVDARVFEDQVARVEVGRPAEATLPAFPGDVFHGRVKLVAPALDPVTRTATVRLELDNPGHRLRPGMFADVSLNLAPTRRTRRPPANCPVSGLRLGSMGPAVHVDVGGRPVALCCRACIAELKSAPEGYLHGPMSLPDDQVLCVPESTVIDNGMNKVVYVEASPGVFQGRAVVLGPRCGDRYMVLDGLTAGERVAAAGAFLIDAETRLNPATRAASTPGVDASGTSPEIALPRDQRTERDHGVRSVRR